MTARYVLTATAEADLRNIIRYTRNQWGEAQARSYIAELTRGIDAVAIGQGNVRNMSALYPALRMLHCRHHYIFCLPRANETALIVAILHERMDLMTRLAGRLAMDVPL